MSTKTEITVALATLVSLKNAKAILDSEPALRGYFPVLEPYHTEVLSAAVGWAAERLDWFPSPAELRGLCEEYLEALAEEAVARAELAEVSIQDLPAVTGCAVSDFQYLTGEQKHLALWALWERKVGVSREAWRQAKSPRDKARLLPHWTAIEAPKPKQHPGIARLIDSVVSRPQLEQRPQPQESTQHG